MTDRQRRLAYVDTGSRGCALQLFSRYRSPFLTDTPSGHPDRSRTARLRLSAPRANGTDYGFAPKT